ncbi:hypothetical protein chiPu_0011413 [Chiloscyllium punctatum]|uniref:Uncharacterized protein n=1 Tax=Chiloscyllium punctatum TaxID=137246 RepID=A0A401SRB9_CHIPU|nr:hypothetical protein [Chiloscyllium punctatum]
MRIERNPLPHLFPVFNLADQRCPICLHQTELAVDGSRGDRFAVAQLGIGSIRGVERKPGGGLYECDAKRGGSGSWRGFQVEAWSETVRVLEKGERARERQKERKIEREKWSGEVGKKSRAEEEGKKGWREK